MEIYQLKKKNLIYLLITFVGFSQAISPLDNDEGYLLLAFTLENGYRPIYVTLKSDSVFGDHVKMEPIYMNTNYKLVSLEEGTYYWDRIYFTEQHYMDISDFDFTISVKKGKINYGGHLALYSEMNMQQSEFLGGARFNFNNKSSKALFYLEKEYAKLLAQYELIYTGNENDHFYNYIQSLPGEGS